MSISSVNSTTTTSTAQLQQQLKTDKKTLSDDEAKKASQQTLNEDQAKVTADEQAIAKASGTQKSPNGVDISA